MECFNCRGLYNQLDRTPRLLINCGHSICQKCTAELYRNNAIICPECSFVNIAPSITCFPRNLALLHIKHNNSNSNQRVDMNFTQHQMCKKHFKQFQAFCEQDRQLLCITCILEDGHRNHPIESIQNSVQKYEEYLLQTFETSKQLESKTLNIVKDVDRHLTVLSQSCEKSLIDITKFYNDIRRIVNDREAHQQKKVKELQVKQEKNLQNFEKQAQAHLASMMEFFHEYDNTKLMDECTLLQSSLQREELIKRSLQTVDSIELTIPFSELNKEAETSSLIQSILNQQIQVTGNQKPAKTNDLQKTKQNKINSIVSATTAVSSNTMIFNNYSHTNQDGQQSVVNNNRGSNPGNHTNSGNSINTTKNRNNTIHNNNISNNMNNSNNTVTPVSKKQKDQVISSAGGDMSHSNITYNKKLNSKSMIANNDQTSQELGKILGSLNRQISNQPHSPHRNTSNNNNSNNNHNNINNNNNNNGQNNNIARQPLNNYHELRNILKEKLNNQRVQVSLNKNSDENSSNGYIPSGGAGGLTPKKNHNARDNSQCPVSRSPTTNVTSNSLITKYSNLENTQNHWENKKEELNIAVVPLNLKNVSPAIGNAPGNMSDSMRSFNINLENYKFNSYQKNAQFDFSGLSGSQKPSTYNYGLGGGGLDHNDTLKNEYGTFLKDNFNPHDITEISSSNRCDFSVLYPLPTQSYIYVLGGFIQSSQYSIQCYDVSSRKWEEVDTLRNNRAKFAVVALMNGNILIMGGQQDGSRVSLCEEFNPKENKTKISDIVLSSAKSGFSAVLKNDFIYVAGGNDGSNILNTFEVYDYKKQSVKTLCKMHDKRDQLAATMGHDGQIYAIGGFGGPHNLCLNTAERYNPITEKWEEIGKLNIPRRALSAVTLPDGIYAIGGFDGYNYLSSVEKYDETLNEWVFACSMNYARCTLSAISTPDSQYIYVFGGFDSGPLNSVQRYSILNDSWEILNPMKHKRFMHAAIWINK